MTTPTGKKRRKCSLGFEETLTVLGLGSLPESSPHRRRDCFGGKRRRNGTLDWPRDRGDLNLSEELLASLIHLLSLLSARLASFLIGLDCAKLFESAFNSYNK
jgi:hypothetical protein